MSKKPIVKDENIWEEYTKHIKKAPKSNKKQFNNNKEIIFKEHRSQDFMNYVGDSSVMCRILEKGDFSNIDGSLAERFRKGKLLIEAKLDLHGCTQDEAYRKLVNFVLSCYSNRKRVIQIVTGKGTSKKQEYFWEERVGKLRELVPDWLNNNQLRSYILCFMEERGNSGALNLLLRKK